MGDTFQQIKRTLPRIGLGLGLRREMADQTFANLDCIDWLECVPENFMGIGGHNKVLLEQAKVCGRPLIPHGVSLSIGSTDDFDIAYLKSLRDFLDSLDAPWYSDHLCFTGIGGKRVNDLLPLPFSQEAVEHVVSRVKQVQSYLGRPFLLENITYYMIVPESEMSEAQFISAVLEKADCGLLLDLNNVHVNSVNHNYCAKEFLQNIPLERTVQIHLAGYTTVDGALLDTHSAPVAPPVYILLEQVLNTVPVNAVMIERDQNFNFTEIVEELKDIRTIIEKTQPDMLPDRKASAALVAPAHTADRSSEKELLTSGSGTRKLKQIEERMFGLWTKPAHSDDKGMRIYSALLERGSADVMSRIFPNCANLLKDKWNQLVADYLSRHPLSHYYVNQIGSQFAHFLASEQDSNTTTSAVLSKYPFLAELADLEWLMLTTAESERDISNSTLQNYADLTAQQQTNHAPVLNPTVSLKEYSYPLTWVLQQLQQGESIEDNLEPEETWVLVFREPVNLTAQIMEVGAAVAHIINSLQKDNLSYDQLLHVTAGEFSDLSEQEFAESFDALMQQLHTASALLGAEELKRQ